MKRILIERLCVYNCNYVYRFIFFRVFLFKIGRELLRLIDKIEFVNGINIFV